MMNAMDKRMTEEDLDLVVGGVKVLMIMHMKNGKINGYHCDMADLFPSISL